MMAALRKFSLLVTRPSLRRRVLSEQEVTQSDPGRVPVLRLVPPPSRNVVLTAEQLRFMTFADIAEVLGLPERPFRVSPGMEDHLYNTVALDEAAESWGDR